jgi:hypothetical protein
MKKLIKKHQTGSQISYNDPRYKDLYNKGLVMSKGSDGVFNAKPMDEFVVESKRPSLYQDLRGVTKKVQDIAAEFTGVPGAIRFSKDPKENIKGLIRTGDQTGLGILGLLPGVKQNGFNYNNQDLESAFNTLDTFGLVSGVAGLARKPIQKGLQQTGKYITSHTPLKNTYKLNPKSLKENSVQYLYRAQPTNFNTQSTVDFMKQEIAAGREKSWYKGVIKSYEEGHPKLVAQNDFHGRWFEKDPSRLDFYLNSADKYDAGTPMEILRVKLDKNNLEKYSMKSNPAADVISASSNTEFVLPKNLINTAEKFPSKDWNKLIEQDNLFNKPHWLKGYKKINHDESLFTNKIGNISNNIDPSALRKDKFHKINEFHKIRLKELQSPEGSKRLRALGITPEELNLPNLNFHIRKSSHYDALTNEIKINLDKDNIGAVDISDKGVYDHELAHYIQRELPWQHNDKYAVYPDQIKEFKTRGMLNSDYPEEYMEISLARPNDIDEDLISNITPIITEKNYDLNFSNSGVKEDMVKHYLEYFQNHAEAYPHLTEIRSKLLDKGIINNTYDQISSEHLNALKPSDTRMGTFLNFNDDIIKKTLLKNLNRLPATSVPIITASLLKERKK